MSSVESKPSYPTPVRAASTDIDTNFPPPPQNKETAPFSVLSSLFDKLQGERKPEKRHRLLNSWFNVYPSAMSCYALKLTDLVALAKGERIRPVPRPEAHLAVCKSNLHTSYVSPAEISQRDKERSVYGLKEKNLAKAYIRLIPLGLKDPDGLRLLQWKRPTEGQVRKLSLESPRA